MMWCNIFIVLLPLLFQRPTLGLTAIGMWVSKGFEVKVFLDVFHSKILYIWFKFTKTLQCVKQCQTRQSIKFKMFSAGVCQWVRRILSTVDHTDNGAANPLTTWLVIVWTDRWRSGFHALELSFEDRMTQRHHLTIMRYTLLNYHEFINIFHQHHTSMRYTLWYRMIRSWILPTYNFIRKNRVYEQTRTRHVLG